MLSIRVTSIAMGVRMAIAGLAIVALVTVAVVAMAAGFTTELQRRWAYDDDEWAYDNDEWAYDDDERAYDDDEWAYDNDEWAYDNDEWAYDDGEWAYDDDDDRGTAEDDDMHAGVVGRVGVPHFTSFADSRVVIECNLCMFSSDLIGLLNI